MEADERLRWFEARVTSSLKPRAEELKNLFSNEESRRCLLEFCNNEEARYLFICFTGENSKSLLASFKAVAILKSKALFFIKSQSAGKITRDNINDDVFYCTCGHNVVQHLEILTREIFLPLLSIEQAGGASADKLMDILHRIISSLQIIKGNIEGEVSLPLPSIEVLSEAAGYSHRKLAVIHILETYLIGWIKQIKNSLKLDPETEIARHHGKKPGPLCEADAWAHHLERIRLINEQLCSPIIVNILTNLEEANSTYAQSFHNVKREISKAELEADENLQFLSTMSNWFQALSYATNAIDIIPHFAPLMHTLYLVWQHSRYYHRTSNLTRLLRMISNEVVKRARDLLGFNVLDDLISAHSNLKEALQICASFRGCYLDTKDKADAVNQQKLAEQVGTRTDSSGVVWHSRMYKDARTPRGLSLFGKEKDPKSDSELELTWHDSPWPARNSQVFSGLNSFMERCNDVLELVETTRHFRMLRNAAEVGGAGGQGLDAMVREIHDRFESAMDEFKEGVEDVLDLEHTQQFERSFFVFRSVIRELECRLGGVLKDSFRQCWDIKSRLRLLEVFEGTSSRDLVQREIKIVVDKFVPDLTDDIITAKELFENGVKVAHPHLPPLANELLWLNSLKERLKIIIEKLKLVSPASLKGDEGWKVRDTYSDLVIDIEKSEKLLFTKWENTVGSDLRLGLKKPLLVSREADSNIKELAVNIDSNLQQILKEVHYLQRPPLEKRLPDVIRALIRNTDPALLQTNAARLSTVVSQYNIMIRTISDIEKPLFELKLSKIDQLLQEGYEKHTWQDIESTDFIESATNLVCNDVFKNVNIVQNNFMDICSIVDSWTSGDLDVFGTVSDDETMYIEEIHSKQKNFSDVIFHSIETGGRRIHDLLQSTFEAVQVSRASPIWQSYTEHVSNIVSNGLKNSVLKSLQLMLRRIDAPSGAEPILAIRLELVSSVITFIPPLTKSSAARSLHEYIDIWLDDYLSRASNVASIYQDEDYMEIIKSDYEVSSIIEQIHDIVSKRIEDCKKYLEVFRDYAFLWMQDVKFTFDEFLKGNISSRAHAPSRLEEVKSSMSNSSKKEKDAQKGISSRASSAITTLNSTTMGTVALSEKTMMVVKRLKLSKEDNAPSLDDFDREMEVYRVARDEIHAANEHCEVGWIKVNMQPIKKTIETYASKWVFTFTKYLADQVSSALNDLDAFLKRIEPGVEAISGEERDIISFMRLMRIFNEVTAQQSELDTKFATMKRTLSLLEKYEQKLPETTQKFYSAAPLRWNNLKMKVNQAKQRLGPRIQAEAKSVTKTLQKFGERCIQLDYDFRCSEAFNRSCLTYTAHNIMDSIEKSLNVIEREAQDLVELQELLEEEVVDFSILPSLRSDLGILRQVWETARLIQEQQSDWKRHRWQKIRPKLLRKLLSQQEDLVRQLPEKAIGWDVTIGIQQSIQRMLSCVPIMEDLSKAAMRTRHWKQLVRATGGAVNVSSDGLTKMTLGQFMDLGLQNHADEVRGVIQRAAKDVGIEKALKTYEEVWLSKMFELVKHTRLSTMSVNTVPAHDTPASEYGNESDHGLTTRQSGSRVSLASLGLRTESRLRSMSIISGTSMRQSVLNLMDQGEVLLLNNIEPILTELELHQLSLHSMLGGSAASSFADDIMKWQKTLQNLEAVLNLWWEAQQKWIKLDDVYNGTECRVGLPKETNLFASSSNDFKQILKLTEKNPNVLQICSREDIFPRLEKINLNFETCLKALFNHLEKRKQKFPRLYFLSQDEVLSIVCKGYDPGQINPYLTKILRNACTLDYDVQEIEDRKFYRITGIRSIHGEILKFVKPVECESSVETWLQAVINAIKSTLQVGLASALGMPIPEGIKIGNNGSRESTIQSKKETKRRTSTSPHQRKVLFAPETEAVEDLEKTARSEMNLPSSWSLRNTNEIVILALQIELTQKFEKCFEEIQAGDKDSLEKMHQHLSAILHSAAGLLRGANASDRVHEVITKQSVDEENEEESSNLPVTSPVSSDLRIFLSPSQIQKLTNLIFILSAKRDLAVKLSNFAKSTDQNENESAKSQVSQSFEWQSQIKYVWSQPNATCTISAMDFDCEYGFEYQGTAARMVCTPETDRALFWITQGLSNSAPCLVLGPMSTSKEELLLELSNAFGSPVYDFCCSNGITTKRIGEIFKGIASTGSWAIFRDLDGLSSSAMSVITQLITNVFESMKAKKSTFLMHDEEIMLSPSTKFFATMNLTSEIVDGNTSVQYPTIISSLYHLPADLLSKFRTVSLSAPGTENILKMYLIIHGFSFSNELARMVTNIYSIWEKLAMIEMMPSVRFLCSLIADAGDHLDELKAVQMAALDEVRSDNRDTVEKERIPSPASPVDEMSATGRALDDEDIDADEAPATDADETIIRDDNHGTDLMYLEQKSILLALRSAVAPSLSGADAVMFATLLGDFFPSHDVPMMFNRGVQDSNELPVAEETIGLSLDREKGAPLQSLPGSPQPKDQALSDIESAIRIAVQRIDLQPGESFVSRVVQLSQLVSSHKTVIVVGPPGCGKTECIRTLIAAHREMSHNIIFDSVYLGVAETENMFGHYKENSRDWIDGYIPSVLRRKLHDICKSEIELGSSDSKDLKWILLDGKIDPSQIETLSDVLIGNDDLVLPNSERLHLPSSIRFIWEIDTLDSLSPSMLSGCGILKMSEDDVGWRLIIQNWLARQSDVNREVLTDLCKRYVQESIDFLKHEKVIRQEKVKNRSIVGYNHPHGKLQNAVSMTDSHMVQNLIAIFEAMIFNAQDATYECFENFFNFSAFWAFGGNLLEEYRKHFSDWWREKWQRNVEYPDDSSLWQCYVHPETHQFVKVSDVMPSYSGQPNSSFSADDHVITSYNMVISHIIGSLADNGKPTLLIGPAGCGKSHVIKERLLNNSSDVAEVQSLFVNANKFITSATLWQRMDEFLEWKHTRTYVPKGNKRLICLIDDVNHSLASKSGNQSACETLRQLLDQNGSFYYEGWKWREVQDVTYLATYNPWTTVSTPKLSERLLNKWVVLHMPYPCEEEQRYIYSTLLKTHFIPPVSTSSVTEDETEQVISSEIIRQREREEAMRNLIESLVSITVEVQGSLRTMFLPTPSRAHFIFTLNNLGIIFRNVCLALTSSCSQEDLITAWKNECENIYGNVLIDNVDKERWMQALHTASRKKLNKSQLEILTEATCVISNLIDIEDTIKKGSKGNKTASENDDNIVVNKTNNDSSKAKTILEHNIHEYNKDNPRVKIYLYEETVKIICRLIRILQSPHECGHAMIISNGFPGLPLSMVKIGAYICGFNLFQIQPSFLVLGEKYTIQHFKADIVNAYTTAGLKGEKLLFVLNEMELYDEDFLVYVTEFLVSNSISHLFNDEEHTSITNAIRTEVTQAGLSYTKETAWNFFLKAVRENLRFVFIVSSMGEKFQKRCRQFPSMINAMQIISMPHWTKEELVATALFHLKDITIFNETEKENIAHLLASMHLVVNELDQREKTMGNFNHMTNTTFERFVEHFVDLAQRRHSEIDDEYEMIAEALEAIESGSDLANQLSDQLDHEKLVLEQKKQGNFTLLSQIGQDKAITEEQVRLVKKQQWKIDKLERLLPRYQDAHERAVFKAAAVVKETKQILTELEQQGLSDLRSMQKPDSDVEDVLAAIIIIVKSPTSDLTWNKGAKRIMANLERFREELSAFDEMEMTEDTLQVVEPYTKRPHFAPGFMEKKTSNLALDSLVMWVRGVVKYHRMMLSRVKPLHKMVEQTSTALEEAVEKLGGMESKLKNLDERMISLSGKYEDASVDKSRQGLLTEDQHHQLTRAAYFEKLLSVGRQQWTIVLESISHRKQSMVGSIAMASGFATYLGVYSYDFRQHVVETLWPRCLQERGIIRDINIADNLTVDITMSMAKIDTQEFVKKLESTDFVVADDGTKLETAGTKDPTVLAQEDVEQEGASGTGEQVMMAQEQKGEDAIEGEPASNEAPTTQAAEDGVQSNTGLTQQEDASAGGDTLSQLSIGSEGKRQLGQVESMISAKENSNSLYLYDQYLLAILKLLTGDEAERNWISRGINYRQLEDAAIFHAAVQTPLLIIDPFNSAMEILVTIMGDVVTVDMSSRDITMLNTIEKSVTAGDTLVLYNIEDEIDPFLFPIIDHLNTKSRLHSDEEPSVIKMNGRRLIIHPSFQLIIILTSSNPVLHDELSSTTTIVDLRPNANGILRFFLLRSIERLRPDLDAEDNKVYYELFQCYDTLEKLDHACMASIRGKHGSGMWDETEVITNLVKKRTQMALRFSNVLMNLQRLQMHRTKFVPLAQTVLAGFRILLSLRLLRREYQFPFNFLKSIFDTATDRNASHSHTKMIYASENGRRRRQENILKRGKENKIIRHTSELLGVNLDKMKHALKTDGKDLFAQKGDVTQSSRAKHDVKTQIELPEEISLNVPELDDNFDNEVQETCINFLKIFHHTVSKSLSHEHQDLFSLLCWMHIKTGTVSNFDSKAFDLILCPDPSTNCSSEVAKRPSWMPEKAWKSLIATSNSAIDLDEIVDSLNSTPQSWHEWFFNAAPESMPFPCYRDVSKQGEDLSPSARQPAVEESDSNLEILGNTIPISKDLTADIKKLLTVKCLRPDRLYTALKMISSSEVKDYQQKEAYTFEELFLNSSVPAIILLPSGTAADDTRSDNPASGFVAGILGRKAEEKSMNLIQVSVFEGSEKQINLSLNNAISTESWILIENLHLGNKTWLRNFTKRLQRLFNQLDDHKNWQLFLTSETSKELPNNLLCLCEKISFDNLASLKEEKAIEYPLIVQNIVKSVKNVGKSIWIESRDRSLVYRNLLYALCVGHGFISTREVYSPRTISTKPRMSVEDLTNGIEFARKFIESGAANASLSISDVCQTICEEIYCSKIVNNCDKNYIRMIFNHISNGLSTHLGSATQFGKWSVPMPPANVDPLEYSSWCIEKLNVVDKDDCSLNALHLHQNAGREFDLKRSNDLVSDLRLVYNKALKEPFSFDDNSHKVSMSSKLRHAIDLCKDRLPPLLKIDEYFGMTVTQINSNPHLRSLTPLSVKSAISKHGEELPTSIGYCLLKESQWLNELIYKISSTIKDLDATLLSGIHAISPALESAVFALCKEEVPDEWLVPSAAFILQSLSHFLSNISKAHSQLSAWLKKGLVPKPYSEPTIGYGLFDVIDLKLLRNPKGFISSVQYAKALALGVEHDEVILRCNFAVHKNKAVSSVKTSDIIILSDVYLDGASYDAENSCLTKQRHSFEKLPYAVLSADKKQDSDDQGYIKFPVFPNRNRQNLMFEIDVAVDKDPSVANELRFNDCYVFLDLCSTQI